MKKMIDSVRWLVRNARLFSSWTDIYRGKTELTMRNGLRVRLESRDDVPTYYKVFGEVIYADPLKRIAKDDPLIVDIGANVGAFVMQARRKFPRATILAFEPSKKTFDILAWNISTNGMQADVRHAAVAATAAERTLFHADTNAKHSLLGEGEGEKVECVTLDSIIDRYGEIDFLKMNCEGAEFEILSTSQKLSKVKMIAVECHHNDDDVLPVLKKDFTIAAGPFHRIYTMIRRTASA